MESSSKPSFKKKPSVPTVLPASSGSIKPQPDSNGDRLTQLRLRIEREKQLKRESGKRFKQTHAVLFEALLPTSQNATKKENKNASKSLLDQSGTGLKKGPLKKTQMASQSSKLVTESVKQRAVLSLAELQGPVESISISSSRVFQREIANQKMRNNELMLFLKSHNLEQFGDRLIEMGYDDIDTLLEVTAEELNAMHMRAWQQDALLSALGSSNQLKKPSMEMPLKVSAWKATTKRAQVSNALTETEQISQVTPFASSGLFLCGLGGEQWSTSLLERKACSKCYQVGYLSSMSRIRDCFYCVACQQNEMEVVSLSASMIRQYRE